MFGQLKDKRKVFIIVVCAFIFIAGLNYLYTYINSKEGLTDDAVIVDNDSENENIIDVEPADKKQSDSSTILPIQSQSSVGPSSIGEPVMTDPVMPIVEEPFTGGDGITKYSF